MVRVSIEKEYNNIVECIKQQKPIKELRYALAEYALKKPALIADGIYSLSQGSWFEEVPRYDVPVIVCFCDPQSEFRGCGDGEIGRKYTSDDVPILIRGLEYRMNDPNGNLGFLMSVLRYFIARILQYLRGGFEDYKMQKVHESKKG